MPRRLIKGGSGWMSYQTTVSDALSISVDSFMSAREKNKQERFRFHGRIHKLEVEEKQTSATCTSDIKDAKKNLVKMRAYKSVYTRYNFDNVVERNKAAKIKDNEDKEKRAIRRAKSRVKILTLEDPNKGKQNSDDQKEEIDMSDCTTNEPTGQNEGDRSEEIFQNKDARILLTNANQTTTVATDWSNKEQLSPRNRSSGGRPDRKVVEELAKHMSAHPEVCENLRSARYRTTGRTYPKIKHSLEYDIDAEKQADNGNKVTDSKAHGSHIDLTYDRPCPMGRDEPNVTTELNDHEESNKQSDIKIFLTAEDTTDSIDITQSLSASQNTDLAESDGDKKEDLKVEVNLTDVLTDSCANPDDETMVSDKLPPHAPLCEDSIYREAEEKLYSLASAFANRPAFRIERDVLPAREPSLVKELGRGRNQLVHGRPRSDVFPQDCRNMFTFRQFMEKQATKMTDILSPDQIRARKIQHLSRKVQFPDLIHSRKTTSAIFRDFQDFRKKEFALNPHARTIDVRLPATAIERPKSPMSRLKERVMLRRAHTAL